MASNLTLLDTQVANLFSVIGGAPLLCMLGSRLLIGMKEAGARDVNLASGASSSSTVMVKTVSQMQFVGGNIHIPASLSAQEMSGFSTSTDGLTDVDEPNEKMEGEKSTSV